MNLGGFTIASHARYQMRRRGISEAQIAQCLATFHTSYPAEPLPHLTYRCTVYLANVDGRELKVYVETGTQPPLVRTVAWKDW